MDSLERVQGVLRLIFLEMDPRKAERGLIPHDVLDVRLQNSLDGTSSAVVHPIVELEIAHRKFRLPDVVLQRIALRLIQTTVLGELSVQPFQCFEILALVRVVQSLSEVKIPELGAIGGARGQRSSQR